MVCASLHGTAGPTHLELGTAVLVLARGGGAVRLPATPDTHRTHTGQTLGEDTGNGRHAFPIIFHGCSVIPPCVCADVLRLAFIKETF